MRPKIKFRPKRAITLEEHEKILAGERNPQLLSYYQLLWHLGGSQTDVPPKALIPSQYEYSP